MSDWPAKTKNPIKRRMTLTDSRRLTGPNLILDGSGAAAELALPEAVQARALDIWTQKARALLDAVGWPHSEIATRVYPNGATLAISAPIDALYAATEIVETAWALAQIEWRAEREDTARAENEPLDFAKCVEVLRQDIASERNPRTLDLAEAARAHGISCLWDDEAVTLGIGRGGKSWPLAELPDPKAVDFDTLYDVPVALVTGTNGKSTTVRLAASICKAQGLTPGFSSSDFVKVGTEVLVKGDYSGPEGARLALRDRRVDCALIETARGGLLRRGLPLPQAEVCLITNIAADHLGEYGIHDVDALAEAKFIVEKAVRSRGTLILNADDARLKSRGSTLPGKVVWYGLSLTPDTVSRQGLAALVQEDWLCLSRDGVIECILPVKDFAPALGGAALYNVSNALAAILLMASLGTPIEAIRNGLLNFESTPEDNPGRGNFMEVGGVKVIVDFAHNPHGLSALTTALQTIPAKRRLYLLGQAGDRSDQDIYEMTRVIHDAQPDTIIVKELPDKLRGRDFGDVPKLIKGYLSEMKYPASQILSADSEFEATVKAFEWAQTGDFLVLLVYGKRETTLDLIAKLQAEHWTPGQAVLS